MENKKSKLKALSAVTVAGHFTLLAVLLLAMSFYPEHKTALALLGLGLVTLYNWIDVWGGELLKQVKETQREETLKQLRSSSFSEEEIAKLQTEMDAIDKRLSKPKLEAVLTEGVTSLSVIGWAIVLRHLYFDSLADTFLAGLAVLGLRTVVVYGSKLYQFRRDFPK